MQKECEGFLNWSSESLTRIQEPVPYHTPAVGGPNAVYSSQLRRLAEAYAAESRQPSVFSHPKINDYETRQKDAYRQIASALTLMADGLDQADEAKTEQGQRDNIAANQLIAAIGMDWVATCQLPR